ncbi:O-antigen ligase family protein [Streptomyces sp. NPDC045431]|uniref:O-antigen ligase family protein n=1 Tax=Streptomyces sp. NPDC045431 TaxID=3155613 RepID=UPI0033F35EBE
MSKPVADRYRGTVVHQVASNQVAAHRMVSKRAVSKRVVPVRIADPAPEHVADGAPGSVSEQVGGVSEQVAEVRRGSDVVGAALLGACAAAALISAAGRDARPEGVLLAVLAVAAGYACGRIAGALLPVAAAAGAALGAVGLVLATWPALPGATAVGPVPPASTGAYAALTALAVGFACCAAAAARRPVPRLVLRLLALGVACAAFALGSVAGGVAGLLVLLCSLAAVRIRRRLPALAALAVAAGLLAGMPWAVAAGAVPAGPAASVEGPLTSYRTQVWRDAVGVARTDPLLGVGPGRFGALSATAQQSPRSDGKPHSAPLQQAAEQGLVGVVLLAALCGWLLYGLWRSPRPTPVALSAAAALTALAAFAAVGSALSFTPVTTAAGLLAGLATAHAPATVPRGSSVRGSQGGPRGGSHAGSPGGGGAGGGG